METTIKVQKSELHAKLRLVGRITQPGKVNPATEWFLISAGGNSLRVTGTDISGSMSASVSCVEVSQEAEFCIDAKKMLDALAELPDQPLTIHVNDFRVTVQYASGQFEIAPLDKDLFPKYPHDENGVCINLKKQIFADGIRQTINCVANDELRPVMNGVFIETKDNKLSFVATNAHVLALCEFDFETTAEVSAIIPKQASKLISAMLVVCDEEVKVWISEKTISLCSGEYAIHYRLIDGRFPNYRAVIPQAEKSVIVHKPTFLGALKRSALFANQTTSLLELNLDCNVLTIMCQDIDCSRSAKEDVSVDYADEKFAIGFDANRLISLVSSVDTEICTLHFLEPSRATLITPDTPGVTLLIMPMLLNS